ncbi:hypothetical protein Tco_1332230 [Tanacetum coccineum]
MLSSKRDVTRITGFGKSTVEANEDSEGEVEEVFDDTAHLMASKTMKEGSGIGKKSLYEQWKETMDNDDSCDDDAHEEFTEAQMAFCKKFDINLRGQARR